MTGSLKNQKKSMLNMKHTNIVQNTRKLLKRVIPYNFRLWIKGKILYPLVLDIWATKSYEVWLILQNLLYLIQPEKLIEFGSGRSTNYLVEYAYKFGKKVLSIEQNYRFYKINNRGLKFSFLPSNIVKYAPIKGNWYDEAKVKKYLDAMKGFDFLLYDGPAEFTTANRNSKKFYDLVVPALDNIKMIVIDDTHRKESESQAKYLAEKFNLVRYDMDYNKTNTLTFLLSRESAKEVQKLPTYLYDLLKPVD